jgi:hypothetical protein
MAEVMCRFPVVEYFIAILDRAVQCRQTMGYEKNEEPYKIISSSHNVNSKDQPTEQDTERHPTERYLGAANSPGLPVFLGADMEDHLSRNSTSCKVIEVSIAFDLLVQYIIPRYEVCIEISMLRGPGRPM